jgi:hypothetical protein
MTRILVAILFTAGALAAGCGAAQTSDDAAGEGTTTGTAPDEHCSENRDDDVLVTFETFGFAPHSTLVVHSDGRSKASVQAPFGGPRVYTLPEETMAELRAGLAEAELGGLDPSYPFESPGPEGVVVESVGHTITACGVRVSAESPGSAPERLVRLIGLLGEIEGLVVQRGG